MARGYEDGKSSGNEVVAYRNMSAPAQILLVAFRGRFPLKRVEVSNYKTF